MPSDFRGALLAHACRAALTAAALAIPGAALADDAGADPAHQVSGVIVTGQSQAATIDQSPATTEIVDAARLADTINLINTEDALKYLPDILVRKRHIGDTQAPMTTRTSGVGSSARSLVYADGVLLSALIGDNNSNASPRWGMVSPDEIARIEVMYGPFSAAYPGNSIGAVVEITTRMPDHLEGSATATASWQGFSQYGTEGTYPARELTAALGDRLGMFSWRLSAEHVTSDSQPLAYVTAIRPAAPAAGGAVATGGFADLNRTGAPIQVLGAGGFEDQAEDNLKLKLALDVAPALRLAYTAGLFLNTTAASAQSYLHDATGAPVYAGSLNLDGYPYTVAASAFSNNVYRFEERHWMQGLSAASDTGGRWDWQAVASLYDYAKDQQRTPSDALPGAFDGGAGSILRMDGTGWLTLDLKAIWRPEGADGAHLVSFGMHEDRYVLESRKFNTADWISGAPGALASTADGKTATEALWAQDVWRLWPGFKLTLGGRFEHWSAYDGDNYSLSPALAVRQPDLSADRFSPKAALQWRADPNWTLTASFGEAYRFPTVTELYQAITTGPTLTVPNPDLRPERALSEELAAERMDDKGSIRLSLFAEDIADALIAQTAPLVPGSTSLFSFVQNIDRTRARGVELVVDRNDVLVRGLELSGSLTYVDAETSRDAAFPAAVGKELPQVPRLRATLVATWRPTERLALTLGARYSDRVFATIDNSDPVTHTFQGFDPYFVVDARANYRIDAHWSAAVGVDNLNNDKYFLFHPFPQRTATAELKYRF